MRFGALDDFELPGSGPRHGARGLCGVVSAVGEDAFDEREEAPRAAIEHEPCTIAILNVGGVDHDVQEETKRIDENVPLAALDLLARIVALRIDRRPPFWAPLALWASMIAAVGLAARPSRSRVAT
jgi:hypothetical protein